MYCPDKSPWHVSETWIRIGFELASNFSVRPTFTPNRQYLRSEKQCQRKRERERQTDKQTTDREKERQR